jgi:hypothetical protein
MGELQKRIDLLHNNFGYIPYTMLIRLVEEMKKDFPIFDLEKGGELHSGLTAIESIYLNYRLEVEKFQKKWLE